MKQKQSALVLLSGGQDSTTCLYWAKNRFEHIHAISFDYGQTHGIELRQARKIAKDALVRSHIIVDVEAVLGYNSSLTDATRDHNKPHPNNPNLPGSFTPGRNMLFLTSAAARAFELNLRNIVTGVCQTDYSGYPDCREAFIGAAQMALSLSMDTLFNIHTPLMHLTKAETWQLSIELGCFETIVNDTMTDYNGSTIKNEWGMGINNNPATALRVKGFEEARSKGWLRPYYEPLQPVE